MTGKGKMGPLNHKRVKNCANRTRKDRGGGGLHPYGSRSLSELSNLGCFFYKLYVTS